MINPLHNRRLCIISLKIRDCFPGKLREDVSLDKVEQTPDADGRPGRRVVLWWPKRGVDVVDAPDNVPLRTWTIRTADEEPLVEMGYLSKWRDATLKGKKRFKAHLIGFRGVGSELGDPFQPEAIKRKRYLQGPSPRQGPWLPPCPGRALLADSRRESERRLLSPPRPKHRQRHLQASRQGRCQRRILSARGDANACAIRGVSGVFMRLPPAGAPPRGRLCHHGPKG